MFPFFRSHPVMVGNTRYTNFMQNDSNEECIAISPLLTYYIYRISVRSSRFMYFLHRTVVEVILYASASHHSYDVLAQVTAIFTTEYRPHRKVCSFLARLLSLPEMVSSSKLQSLWNPLDTYAATTDDALLRLEYSNEGFERQAAVIEQ